MIKYILYYLTIQYLFTRAIRKDLHNINERGFSMTNLCKMKKIPIPRDIFIQRSICESREVLNFIESQV